MHRRQPSRRHRSSTSKSLSCKSTAIRATQPIRASDRIILKAPEHPFAGAEVGVDEAAPLVRLLNTDFTLDRIVVKSPADVASAVLQAADAGTHFFLIDAPADAYRPLAAADARPQRAAVQRIGAGRRATPRPVRGRIRSRLSEPRPAHGRSCAIRRVAQMDERPGIPGPLARRRGDDGGVRAFGAEIRRPHRRAAKIQARHRSARPRAERSRRC